MKKYVLTDTTKWVEGIKLHRVKAIRNFADVKVNEVGGWIEKESNLLNSCDNERYYDFSGNSWVRDNAKLCHNAVLYGNATLRDNACARDNAQLCDNAVMRDNSIACDDSLMHDNTVLRDNALLCDNGVLAGDAVLCGDATLGGNAVAYANAFIGGKAVVDGIACIGKDAYITKTSDYMVIQGLGNLDMTGVAWRQVEAITFYKTKTGINVSCGNFNDTINEFRNYVKCKTNEYHEYIEYSTAIDLAKLRLSA